MARLNRDTIRNKVIKPSLAQIGDFNEDGFEDLKFRHLHNFSWEVFLSSIKQKINQLNCDVLLNLQEAKKWDLVKDCIDYVKQEHFEL